MLRQTLLGACVVLTSFSITTVWTQSSTEATRIRWEKLMYEDTKALIQETTLELAKNPQNALALRMRSSAFYREGEPEKGKADAVAVLALLKNPTNAEEFEAKCYTERRLEKYDEAILDCTRAIELDPKFAWAYYNRASANAGKKQSQQAVADFTKAIELNPGFSDAYFSRGGVFVANKDYDKAIADFTKVVELDSKNPFAYFSRGFSYEQKQAYDLAIADYTKASELNPRSPAPLLNMADIQCGLGQYDAGLNNFSKAIMIDPKLSPAYSRRGYCYFLKRQYEAAIADDDKAIQLDPKNASAYADRAAAVRELNFKSLNPTILCTAFNDVSKAIVLAPKWNYPYRVRSYLFEDFILGRSAENELSCLPRPYSSQELARSGIKDAEKAIELNPQDDLAFFKKGRLHFYLEEYDLALRDLDKTLQLNPQNGPAYCVRGQLHGAMGNAAKKAQDLQKYSSFKLGECQAFRTKQSESSSRQLPSSNRKGPCGCYACGVLLAVDFPNKSPDCVGTLATDACPTALVELPDKGAAYCKQVRIKSKDGSFAGCSALARYCDSLDK